jgi:hypothetical protein
LLKISSCPLSVWCWAILCFVFVFFTSIAIIQTTIIRWYFTVIGYMRMAAGRKKEKGGQGVEPCLRIGLFFYSCKIRLQLAYWERVEKNPDFSRYTIAFEKEKNGVYIHYNMYYPFSVV